MKLHPNEINLTETASLISAANVTIGKAFASLKEGNEIPSLSEQLKKSLATVLTEREMNALCDPTGASKALVAAIADQVLRQSSVPLKI